MQSKVSGHWTDEQLIAYLYGVAPQDNHVAACGSCQARVAQMRTSREMWEQSGASRADVTDDFLAAQRRQIYAKMAQPERWWSGAHLRRWASATATLLVLAGGFMVYEEHHEQALVKDQVSDAQLAAQVSNMTQNSEPSPTAPLEALFEE